MRILAISPRIPAAGRNGDQVLSYFRIAHLARHHTVRVICFGREEQDIAARNALESFGVTVQLIQWRVAPAALSLARALFDGTPFQCAFYESIVFRRAFDAALREFNPDAVYCVMVRTMRNALSYQGSLFVDMIDSMALNFFRRSQMASGWRRLVLRAEYKRIKEFERRVAARASISFVVSDIDRREIGVSNVHVIPLGIDMSRFSAAAQPARAATIAFTGNMFYAPNVEAIVWFCERCWPDIKRAIPDARLVIAGNRPDPRVVALSADKSIQVTGRVDSIVTILNAAAVAIAPMQSGSGMQFKILEAMACAVPVVASTLGLGDISAAPGRDILIADSPEAFTAAVLSLLRSENLCSRIGTAGLRYVREQHDWEVLNERFENACGLAAPTSA